MCREDFIKREDYSVVLDERELLVIDQHPADFKQAEKIAIEETASYLRNRYDMDKVFANTNDRNPMLVAVIVNISIWYLIHRLPEMMGYERRQILYDEAISWLKLVQSGKVSPLLDKYTDNKENNNKSVVWGSQKANKYDY